MKARLWTCVVFRNACVLLFISSVHAAVDGGWGDWKPWTPCSATCGQGVRRRYRACNNPLPGLGGKWCDGKHTDTESCSMNGKCSVDGNWSEWSLWTSCSVSCGEGASHRERFCDSPMPRDGGKECEGISHETQTCFALKDCPRDGKWSSWSQWSLCSVTCGAGGSIHRYRSCNNPPPSGGGARCRGRNHDTMFCKAPQDCPVNGQWSEWADWTECSVSCGSGEHRRWRSCDNPPPQYGGLDCNRTEAGEMQIRSCNGGIEICPVDGGWSDWSEWGDCNTPNCSDKISYSFRQRVCSRPLPSHGGSMCQGTFLQAGLCGMPVNCEVNGGFSEWSAWTCEVFVAQRHRFCDNPPPSNGGKNCAGEKIEFYEREDKQYSEVCPNMPSDDEDFQGSGSGSPEAEDG